MGEHVRSVGLVQRLRAAQRARWRGGRRLPVEAHLARYPFLHAYPEDVLELIYQEILLREERGESPQPEEYAGRFPELAPRLGPLFEVHRAIRSGALRDALGPA